jgi:hypothetical protein
MVPAVSRENVRAQPLSQVLKEKGKEYEKRQADYEKEQAFVLTIHKLSGDTVKLSVHERNTMAQIKEKLQEQDGGRGYSLYVADREEEPSAKTRLLELGFGAGSKYAELYVLQVSKLKCEKCRQKCCSKDRLIRRGQTHCVKLHGGTFEKGPKKWSCCGSVRKGSNGCVHDQPHTWIDAATVEAEQLEDVEQAKRAAKEKRQRKQAAKDHGAAEKLYTQGYLL